MTSDDQAIRTLHATWIDAVNLGDLETLDSLMATDVVFVGPGQAPFGKSEFPAGFSQAHRQFDLRCVSELTEVVVAGDWAFSRATDSLWLMPRNGGEVVAMAGHRLTVYRRGDDGYWRFARDAHTLQPVGPEMPTR